MESARRNFLQEARQRWKLTDAACAILEQFHGPFDSAEALARTAKDCCVPLLGPRPLAEAISTAGGIAWEALDDHLMLRKLPGVYAAGEMIDWEAPTGGFLLQACFATGTRAGRAANVDGFSRSHRQ
jgi:predicted flavoprotein YhiN